MVAMRCSNPFYDFGSPSYAVTLRERRTFEVDTTRDDVFAEADQTGPDPIESHAPDPIATLDIEVQAMFERVRVRLGLRESGREMLGRYELRDWIGRGGMGEVYRAYDTELEREVAVKLIAPRPGTKPQLLRRRLRREAQLLARLDHENLVRVYDSGSHDGSTYLVMELVDGATLRQLQAASKLTTNEILRYYAEAGRGLLAAHSRGVIHRDFKPDNVFVGTDGRARVGDFGLAHLFGEVPTIVPDVDELDASGATRIGDIVGTLGYMAPEQLRGEALDARADQYAFCASVWEALGGNRPFSGPNARAVLEAMEGSPHGGVSIDGRLRRALRTGLSPRPGDRHETMAQLVAAIQEVLERPKRRRRRLTWSLLGLAALGGIVGTAIGYEAANPDCPLADEVGQLEREADWSRFDATASRGVQRRLAQMKREAERACISRDVAAMQHVESLLSGLRSLLAADDWRDHIEAFEADFASKASVPMSAMGYGVLANEVRPLEDAWALEQLVARCDEIASIPWPEIDRAGLLLPCARARSIRGDYDGAIDDFKQARETAEIVGDRTRRLQATLGAARTTITRLQQYEAGAALLEPASDLLRVLEAPITDPRRAEFDELSAILAREDGKLDEALALQHRVVAHQLLAGAAGRRSTALLNLANLHDKRGEPIWAETIYRIAMRLDPGDPEVVFNLGRLLVNEHREGTEARALLSDVLSTRDHDLLLTTTTMLLILEIGADDLDAIAEIRGRLTTMLLDEMIPRTPEQAAESWRIVTLAHACYSDMGPAYQQARSHVPEWLIDDLDLEIAHCTQPVRPKDQQQQTTGQTP